MSIKKERFAPYKLFSRKPKKLTLTPPAPDKSDSKRARENLSSPYLQEVDLRVKPITEKEFMQQVTELATRRGWHWLHIATAQYSDNWRTPYSGDLGKGWPDLFLVRGTDMLFLELKSEAGKLTGEQAKVLALLSAVAIVRWYHPSDWDLIEEMLR